MSRLIAFGCSSTFGQGLSDCAGEYEPNVTLPSKFAWPSILAELMGRDCCNMSAPCSSNKRIMYTIKNFHFEKTDIVYILWSMPERYAVFKKPPSNILNISPADDRYEEYYKKFYDDYDCFVMDDIYKDYTFRILTEQNLEFKYLHFKKDHITYPYFENIWWSDGGYYNAKDRCEDGIHANQASHARFANDLYLLYQCTHPTNN